MVQALPHRSDVPEEQTWDIDSVYTSDVAWEAAYRRADKILSELASYAGRLNESAVVLLDALRERDRQRTEIGRIREYTWMQANADLGEPEAAARLQRATDLRARFLAATAFIEPELLAIAPEHLASMTAESPELAVYAHYFDTLEHKRAHMRSPEIEQIIASASDIAADHALAYKVLVNAEIPFGDVPDGMGGEIALAQGNVRPLTANRHIAVRRAAWEAYADGHLAFRSTIATGLNATFKRHRFVAQTRGYPSALDATLEANHLPRAVFDNLMAVCRRHLPLWHRYWEIRRRALGVEALHGYDIDVPLVRSERVIPYARGREIVIAALAPLGEEYCAVLRRALYEERWVDWAANRGKLAGASSGGVYGTRPFLLLTYDNSAISVSALAHEIGHSLHSYYAWETQPRVYADYDDAIGETAATTSQALVRAHLLATEDDPDFQLEVLSEAFAYFHRYLFVMPLLSRFELACHDCLDRGEGLSADVISANLLALFREGYGSAMTMDEARVGIAWAQFPHLFMNFYTHTYALGIAAATALAQGVLDDGVPAASRYVDFLRASDSVYPLDALRIAGIDMASAEPVERAFAVLEQMIDRLDGLV